MDYANGFFYTFFRIEISSLRLWIRTLPAGFRVRVRLKQTRNRPCVVRHLVTKETELSDEVTE